MKIKALTLENEPEFSSQRRFLVGSPVFIKRSQAEEKGAKFFYVSNCLIWDCGFQKCLKYSF
ncbi:hypothetical protein BWI92_26435 [Flectobacillus sp. BAB-3569]|nr:hypothetical protein BWI92_26435 [Flectobacillus sp. BAB-3569]